MLARDPPAVRKLVARVLPRLVGDLVQRSGAERPSPIRGDGELGGPCELRRYVADSMQEAIARVKADFGKDAVILHTKRIRRGGLSGLFGPTQVEVIAAAEGQRRPPQPREPARAPRAATSGCPPRARERGPPRELAEVTRSSRRSGGPSKRQGRQRRIPALQPLKSACWTRRSIRMWSTRDSWRCSGPERGAAGAGGLAEGSGPRPKSRGIVGPTLGSRWRGRVQCLVGPTGVGKTTTIAKLAANYSLLAGKRVALITVDTYRIAAVEQLKTYAEIIGVPSTSLLRLQELKDAIERRSDYDLILVDTAGRSQKHKMQMQELRALYGRHPRAQSTWFSRRRPAPRTCWT